MLAVRIIPCLDVRDGRTVKGVNFLDLRDMGDPAELAERYQDEGADEIVFLDVSATLEGRRTFLPTVENIRARISIPLACGGGVRSADDARRLLEAGADKISLNSRAIRDPESVTAISERYGRQCAVVAIDASRRISGGWETWIDSGKTQTGLEACAWAAKAESLGAGEILLTSRDRDGTKSGYDLELVAAIASATSIPVIASGGANGPEHFLEAIRAGASAVLAASIFHEGTWTVGATKRFLAERGVEVRS